MIEDEMRALFSAQELTIYLAEHGIALPTLAAARRPAQDLASASDTPRSSICLNRWNPSPHSLEEKPPGVSVLEHQRLAVRPAV
jgi:hypothetical protein